MGIPKSHTMLQLHSWLHFFLVTAVSKGFSQAGAEVLIPHGPAWHRKWERSPRRGAEVWLTWLCPRGLAEGTCSGSSLMKRQDSSALVSLWTHLHTHTHTPPSTRTHSFTHPQASGLLCNINLTFIYSLLWEICAISANQAPNKPYYGIFSLCFTFKRWMSFSANETDEKKVAAFMKRWRFITTTKKKKVPLSHYGALL